MVRRNHRSEGEQPLVAAPCPRTAPGTGRLAPPPVKDRPMRGELKPALIAVLLILLSATQSWSQPQCRPTLAFTEAHYTPMQLPKLERTWTIAFTVDASRCATD